MREILDQLDYALSAKPEPEPAPVPASGTAPEPASEREKYSCGLERDPELLEFIALLERYAGVVRVRDQGNGLGLRFPDSLSRSNLAARRHLSNLLYCGETVPFLACLFADGDWNGHRIRFFAGIGSRNGEERRGRGKPPITGGNKK